MRRLSVGLVLGWLMLALGSLTLSNAEAVAPVSEPVEQSLLCSTVCDKLGVNTAWGVLRPPGDYLRTQQLGSGWILEIAYSPSDIKRTVEAVRRAHERDLQIVIRICAGNSCLFSAETYAVFLKDVAAQVDGPFWAMMGPNEPDLEFWAGDAIGVTAFMNYVIGQVQDVPNIRMLSPGFNLTNGITHNYFLKMQQSGARFADLDGFSGTSYNVSGNTAYYYYASNTAHAEKFRQKVVRYGKPFIFIEYGSFGTSNHPDPADPVRVSVINALKNDFAQSANDPTVMGIVFFNPYGTNPGPAYHILYNPEMIRIGQSATCVGRGYHESGVGMVTANTLWQMPNESSCRAFMSGCPFIRGASMCGPDVCVDNDADGLTGDGGVCQPTDCDDTRSAVGASCSGSAVAGAWGTLRTIDMPISSSGNTWPIVELASSGLPVIAYHDDTPSRRTLNVLECKTADCSSAVRRVALRNNSVGQDLSMAVRPDGRPFMVFVNGTDGIIEILSCNDPGCISGQHRVIDPAWQSGYWGSDTSVVIRPDGRPIIAYWYSVDSSLRVYDCADADCTSGQTRVLDQSAQSGQAPTILIGSDGLPLISSSRGWYTIRLTHCSDENCTNRTSVTPASSAHTKPTAGMALRPDGTPLILYQTQSDYALWLYECADAACATGTSHLLYDADSHVYYASIVLLADGTPFIAFSEYTSTHQLMGMIHCTDTSCNETSKQFLTGADAGEHPDMVLQPDGSPLVVYHRPSDHSLVAYQIDLELVTGEPQETPEPSGTSQPGPAPTATVAVPAPAAPVLTAPINGGLTNSVTPLLGWNQSANAATYRVQISTTKDFTYPLVDAAASTNSFTAPPLTAPTYFWRVQAINSQRAGGAWSAVSRFTIDLTPPPAPLLSSPGVNAIIAGTPIFTWGAASTAIAYQFEYALDANFAAVVYTSPVITTLNHKPPTISPAVYYWHVRARDAAGNWSVWSLPRTVTINLGIPVAPILTSPATNALTNDTTPDFTWNDVPYGDTYQIQIDTVSSFSSAGKIDQVLSPGVRTFTPDSPLITGVKYWRVRAINANNQVGAWTGARVLTIDLIPPPVPTLVSPGDTLPVRGDPVYKWYAVTSGVAYELQVASSPSFDALTLNVIGSTVKILTTNHPLGLSYWKVRARDAAGNWSEWTAVRTLNVLPVIPVAPALISPVNGSTQLTATPTFTWSAVTSGATYEIQVDNNSTFASPEFTNIGNSTAVTTSFLPNSVYYWRIRARNVNGEPGSWSGARSVIIKGVATPTPTLTPSPTVTPTPSSTPTSTDEPTPTETPAPTETPLPTDTPTPTGTPTETPTDEPTPTETPTE